MSEGNAVKIGFGDSHHYYSFTKEALELIRLAPSSAVLAKHLIDHVNGDGENDWNQESWVTLFDDLHNDINFCGTESCIAGEAAIVVGFIPIKASRDWEIETRTHTGDMWSDIGQALLGCHLCYNGPWGVNLFDSSIKKTEILEILNSIVENDLERVITYV